MTWGEVLSLVAVVLAAVALALALHGRRLLRGAQPSAGPLAPAAGWPDPAADRPLVAFVANPSKSGVPELRATVVAACAGRYLPEPLWLETTPEDPGLGQAREAVERGAQVVVAVGGDGTVRAVAEGLVGTDVAMGLLPQGTGNLLARNLDLPLGDVTALLDVALGGHERRIDVGWLTVDQGASDGDPSAGPAAETGSTHLFLVIAGLGFDAAMVAGADEQLKARVGWVAYFVAGVQHLHARRMRIDVALDEGPWQPLRLRSLLVGNCGRLPGGITLLPDAVLDDGWLDVAAIDTRVGVFGWTQLFGEVAMQRFGMRAELPNKIGTIDHARARRAKVRSREPQQVQVDGDVVGAAVAVRTAVEPSALTVRVP